MTIDSNWLAKKVCGLGFSLFAGVPDSLLGSFVASLENHADEGKFYVLANEGNAVAMAVGSYLATGEPGLVYLQNSGLGNAYNPLSSLASQAVSSVPCVLIIGWRGEILPDGSQGIDEPQHLFQGKITGETLDSLDIEWEVLPSDQLRAFEAVARMKSRSVSMKKPVAILVRSNLFDKAKQKSHQILSLPSRAEYISALVEINPVEIPIIATTGYTSRELLSIRKLRQESVDGDFLMVGSMGHAISIASGIAVHFSKKIICLDGDGGALMHAGSLSTSAQQPNIIHIVINNGVHDSVGGQATAFSEGSFAELGNAFNYGQSRVVDGILAFKNALIEALEADKSSLIECRTSVLEIGPLPRPEKHPRDLAQSFSQFLLSAKKDK